MQSKFTSDIGLCIYLDQFAVSDIAEKNDSSWIEIGNLLNKGLEENKLFCPYSAEHMIESSGKPFADSIINDKALSKLSKNYILFHEFDVTINLLICLIRRLPVTSEQFIFKGKIGLNYLNLEQNYQKLEKSRANFNNVIEETVSFSNLVRKISKNNKNPPFMKGFLIKHISQSYSDELLNRFEVLEKGEPIETIPLNIAGLEFPFWADYIFIKLTSKEHLTVEESHFGKLLIEKYGVEIIPTIQIRASLEALMAFKNIEDSKNHQIDISRISAALIVSDIMLLDGGKANDVKELKLDDVYGTQIFSGKRGNRELFIDLLKTIL